MFHLNRAIGGKLTLSVVGLEKKGEMDGMDGMDGAGGRRSYLSSLLAGAPLGDVEIDEFGDGAEAREEATHELLASSRNSPSTYWIRTLVGPASVWMLNANTEQLSDESLSRNVPTCLGFFFFNPCWISIRFRPATLQSIPNQISIIINKFLLCNQSYWLRQQRNSARHRINRTRDSH